MIAFVVFCFNACKKNESSKPLVDDPVLEKVKQNIQKQIEADGGIPVATLINQKLPVTLVDMDGNPVPKSKLQSMRLLSTCASDIPDFVDLTQYIRVYNCGSTTSSTIQFEFKVSWNNTIVNTSPFNSSLTTRGRVRITFNNSVVNDVFTTNAKITDLGTDTQFPGNNIYAVKFTCTGLNDIYLTSNQYVIRLAARFVSDCSSLDQYSLALSDPAGYGITPGAGSEPCNRVDKVYIQLPGTLGPKKIGVAGVNMLGNTCYGTLPVAPDLSEVQYSLDGGSTWINTLQNYLASPTSLGIYNSRFIREFDLCRSNDLASGTYTIIIRYKNWKYNTAPGTGFTWPIPTTTTACRTYGNDNANSYIYEYYPNITIP